MQSPRSLWTWNGRLRKPEQPAADIHTSKTETTNTENHGITNLYYYRARFYDPAKGRFITRDPKGYVDSLNMYAFVMNNPMNMLDPLGLFGKDVHQGMTYFLAARMGLNNVNISIKENGQETSVDMASLIAVGNQQTDEQPVTSPTNRLAKDRPEHFPWEEGQEVVQLNDVKVLDVINQRIFNAELSQAEQITFQGMTLHTYQDTSSHEGKGNLHTTRDVDDPSNETTNPKEQLQAMIGNSIGAMIEIARQNGVEVSLTDEEYAAMEEEALKLLQSKEYNEKQRYDQFIEAANKGKEDKDKKVPDEEKVKKIAAKVASPYRKTAMEMWGGSRNRNNQSNKIVTSSNTDTDVIKASD